MIKAKGPSSLHWAHAARSLNTNNLKEEEGRGKKKRGREKFKKNPLVHRQWNETTTETQKNRKTTQHQP
jgi:hypothetical protein